MKARPLQQSQCVITSTGCIGDRVSRTDEWYPHARRQADAKTSGVSHPDRKCSVSCPVHQGRRGVYFTVSGGGRG